MANNLLSYFPDFIGSDSLFQKMVDSGAPWDLDVGKSMDLAFFTMYSGIKNPTFFVRQNSVNGIAKSEAISSLLWNMFGKNWTKLWESYILQYDPISNYNVTEETKRIQTDARDIQKDTTLSSTVDRTGEASGTKNQTDKIDYGKKIDREDSATDNITGSGTESLEHGHIVATADDTDKSTETSGTSDLTHGHKISTSGTSEDSGSNSGTSDLTHGHKVVGTSSAQGEEDTEGTSTVQNGQTISTTGDTKDYVYGFNSEVQQPTQVSDVTSNEVHGGTDTTTSTGKTTTNNSGSTDETHSGVDSTVTSGSNSLTRTNSQDQTNSGKDSTVTSGDSTEKTNRTVTETNSGTDTTTRSNTSQNASQQTGSEIESGTDTTTVTGSDSQTTTAKDVRADTGGETTKDNLSVDENISRTRSGNIGQNTYQELLRQQFELWKWNFFWQVFEDCDKFLCLSIFDICGGV